MGNVKTSKARRQHLSGQRSKSLDKAGMAQLFSRERYFLLKISARTKEGYDLD